MIAIINDLAFSSPPVELSPGLETLVLIEENTIFLRGRLGTAQIRVAKVKQTFLMQPVIRISQRQEDTSIVGRSTSKCSGPEYD
jgi:hypothetical protein